MNNKHQNHYLGIDFGTSAVRVCLIDENEDICAFYSAQLNNRTDTYGRIIQEPEEWIVALKDCFRQLHSEYDVSTVQSIAVDGTSATTLLCDIQGQPLTPALMYNDKSSGDESRRLETRTTLLSIALSPSASLPKAMQLAAEHAETSHRVLHQADWITGWLSDDYGYSDENNVLKLGYDVIEREWPAWVTEVLPASTHLPDVKIPGSLAGHAGKYLQSLGFSEGTRIVAGTTDSTASFLATGIERSNIGATTLGSTLVLKQLSHTPIADLESGIYSHRLGDTWLVGGASNTGGAVIAKYFDTEQIVQLSQIIDPESDSALDYYPLPATGERFPINNPALLSRLSPRPANDADFLHGLFEGIAKIEKLGYKRLQELGATPVKSVITSGGGAANAVWQAIRSRILGIPVSKALQTEAAYGTAMLAKHGTSLFQKFDS